MPLPKAMLERLAKRGLVPKPLETEEEIIAENYDSNLDTKRKPDPCAESKFLGFPGCPNKWNMYHECNNWCSNTWGNGNSQPSKEYTLKYKIMMRKYGALPDGWMEKYDCGTGRHYFWCLRTDKVSWLHPKHSKAKITEAASKLRELIQNQLHDNEDDDEDEDEDEDVRGHNMDIDYSDDSDNEERDEKHKKREKDRRREDYDRHRSRSSRKDPMDPSSYSDTPRGTWSSGLDEARGESKKESGRNG